MIFGFLSASAKIIVSDTEIVQLRAKVQFLKYHIKGPGVHPPHDLGGNGCLRRGRLYDPAAVDLYPFRFRGRFRLLRRFQRACQQFLRLTLHPCQQFHG